MSDVPSEAEELIGEVTHYFAHVPAAVLRLDAELKVDDTIHIVGHTTDLVQTIQSMQVEHESVESAGPGDDVAVQIKDRVREGDKVYRQA